MLRGFYTAASGMISQQRHQEVLSNNIANENTPGYKADQATLRAFPEMLLQAINTQKVPAASGLKVQTNHPIGSLNTGVYVQEHIPDHAQGDIRETGLATDLALVNGELPDENGSVFFTVQGENGETQYTRSGNFTIDGQGFLVTNEGYYVLDHTGRPIQTDGMTYTVSHDGVLQTGDQSIPLGISYIANTNALTKEDNGLFRGEADPLPAQASFSVQQGALEQSNVDTMQTMTEMMESYRMFETNQRVLKAYDESMGKAVTEVGRIG